MIERFETDDPHDRRLVPGLEGLLGTFNAAGVLAAADVHTATRIGELVGETDERLRLAVALAVRAARHGSVCVDLTAIRDGDDLPWPDPDGWTDDVAASAFAASVGATGLENATSDEVDVDVPSEGSSSSEDDEVLSVGAIIGIAIGGFFFLVFAAAGLYFFCLRTKANSIAPASG